MSRAGGARLSASQRRGGLAWAAAAFSLGLHLALGAWLLRQPVKELPLVIGAEAVEMRWQENAGGAPPAQPPEAPPAPAEAEALPPPAEPPPALRAEPSPTMLAEPSPAMLAEPPPPPAEQATPPVPAPVPAPTPPPPTRAAAPSPPADDLPLPAPPPPAPPAPRQAARPAPAAAPTPAPAPAEESHVRLGPSLGLGETRQPRLPDGKCLEQVPYPPEAERYGWTGRVALRLRLADDGRVVVAEVQESSGYPALDEAARASAKSCRFEPALREGRAVWSSVRASVTFRLR